MSTARSWTARHRAWQSWPLSPVKVAIHERPHDEPREQLTEDRRAEQSDETECAHGFASEHRFLPFAHRSKLTRTLTRRSTEHSSQVSVATTRRVASRRPHQEQVAGLGVAAPKALAITSVMRSPRRDARSTSHRAELGPDRTKPESGLLSGA